MLFIDFLLVIIELLCFLNYNWLQQESLINDNSYSFRVNVPTLIMELLCYYKGYHLTLIVNMLKGSIRYF